MTSYGDVRQIMKDLQTIHDTVKDIKNADKEKADILRQTDSLFSILSDLTQAGFEYEERYDKETKDITDQLKPCVEELRSKLQSASKSKGLFRWWSRNAKWPLEKRDITPLQTKIQGLSDQLSLATGLRIMGHMTREKSEAAMKEQLDAWTPSISKELEKVPARMQFVLQGPGELLQSQSVYNEWESSSDGLLWVKGIQGTGKTGLAVALADYLVHDAGDPPKYHVARIFCDHQSAGKNDSSRPMDIVMSFWSQLVFKNPYPQLDKKVFDAMKKLRNPGIEEKVALQKDLFTQTLRRLKKVILILDGLDEIPRDLQKPVVEHLKDIQRSSGECRILITSRPYGSIERLFEDDLQFYLKTRDVDLREYILEHASRRGWDYLDERGLELLIERLIPKCRGIFLMAKLFMDEIVLTESERQCFDLVDTLPTNVAEAYDRGLVRLAKEFRKVSAKPNQLVLPCQAIRALFWVAFLNTPMKSTQLRQALSMDDGTDYDPLNEYWKNTDIDCLTGRLLVIDSESELRVAHRTLTEHLKLETTLRQWFPTFSLIDMKHHIADTLLRSISPGCIDYNNNTKLCKKQFMKLHPLYPYALKNWGHGLGDTVKPGTPLWQRIEKYLREPSKGWNEHVKEEAATLLSTRSIKFDAPYDYLPFPQKLFTSGSISGLHWAVVFDLPMFIPALSSYHQEMCLKTEPIAVTPLGLTAPFERSRCTKALIESGIDINIDQNGHQHVRQPLYDAITQSHEEIISILLDNGADLTLRGHHDKSPLDVTYELGQFDIAKMLARRISGSRPTVAQELQLLVRGAFVEDLQRAIGEGLDVNHQCENGKMALDYAEETQNSAVLAILKEAKAISKLSWPATRLGSSPCPVNFLEPAGLTPIVSKQTLLKDHADFKCGTCSKIDTSHCTCKGISGVVTVECKGQKNDEKDDLLLFEVPIDHTDVPIRSIVFETISRDQGWSSWYSYKRTGLGSTGSRIEVCVADGNGSSHRCTLQLNMHASDVLRLHTNIWNLSELKETSLARADLLERLQGGSKLQIWLVAQGALWESSASFVRIRMYDREI